MSQHNQSLNKQGQQGSSKAENKPGEKQPTIKPEMPATPATKPEVENPSKQVPDTTNPDEIGSPTKKPEIKQPKTGK